MRRILATVAIASLCIMMAAGAAWARNPHCAGGIQYLTQALADQQKGNLDDYHREIQKSIQQLEMCSSEDPADLEALGYLGWAYAQVDSMCAAGQAFDKAIAGMTAKNDKKLELVKNNRESFWATSFNKGISEITAAQELYNPYTKTPETDADKTQRDLAKAKYDAALVSLNHAQCLKPTDTRTIRNIGSVHAFMGDYVAAAAQFKKGLEIAPGDSDLTAAYKASLTNRAGQLLDDKKFDEAEAFYQDLLKTDPKNCDLWAGIGDARFNKVKSLDAAAKKPAYKAAGDAYAKAAECKKDSPELAFNAALCYTNSSEWALAEPQWRGVLALNPKDGEAMAELATVLAEMKKFPDAIAMGQKSLALDPKDKVRYQRLGSIYSKAGDNLHSKQFLLAYLALNLGKETPAPTDASGAAGTKLQGSMGKPDAIDLWEADGQKYETWFYYSKGQAYHFGGGSQLEKTDWSAALASN